MAKDFSAKQIRTNTLIASGGIAGAPEGLGLVVYSASVASNFIGGHSSEPVMFADVGTDVFFFISGSKGSKVARGAPSAIPADGHTGVTLFGGDVVFSGTMYADKMVVELDLATTGSVTISGSLIVSQSATIKGVKTVYGNGLINRDVGLHFDHPHHGSQIVWDNNDARIFETTDPPGLGGSPSLYLSSSSRIRMVFPKALYGYGSDIRLTATGSENNTAAKLVEQVTGTGGSIILSASENFQVTAGNYIWLSGSQGLWYATDGALNLSASSYIRHIAGDYFSVSGSSVRFIADTGETSWRDGYSQRNWSAGDIYLSGTNDVIVDAGDEFRVVAGDLLMMSSSAQIFSSHPQSGKGSRARGTAYNYFKRYLSDSPGVTLISGSHKVVTMGWEVITSGSRVEISAGGGERAVSPGNGDVLLSGSDDVRLYAGDQMLTYADECMSWVEKAVYIKPGIGTHPESRGTFWALGTDISFAVSGTVGSRGVASSVGTAMFAGDMVISGTLAALGGFSSALYHENPVSPFTSPVASGDNAIAMGSESTATGDDSVVGGGSKNKTTVAGATIAGGRLNTGSAIGVAIGGGLENVASDDYATIGGGGGNDASATYFTIGGGLQNTGSAVSSYGTIAGGRNNHVRGTYSALVGGNNNWIDGTSTFIGGGSNNTGSGDVGVIVGGTRNCLGSAAGYTFIGGGYENSSSGDYAFIGAGRDNSAHGTNSIVVGGKRNSATGFASAILGSTGSTASGKGTIAIGTELTASEDYTIHLGGGAAHNYFTAVVSGSLNVLGDRPESKVNIFAGELNPNRSVASAGSVNISGSIDVKIESGDNIDITTKDVINLGIQGSSVVDYIKITGAGPHATANTPANALQINPDRENVTPIIKGLNKVGFTMSYTGNAQEDQVLILSGGINETGGGTSIDERGYSDMNFFVSGTVGSRGTETKGTSVFGGDVVISGSLYGGSPMSVGNTTEISGALYLQDQGSAPGIAASGGSVLYSRAGTLYFKPAGGAESSLGGGWIDEGNYVRLDTLTDRVTLGGTSVPAGTLQVGNGTGQTGHIIVTGGATVSASISFSKGAAATNAAVVLDNNENLVLVQSGSGDIVLKTAGGLNYFVGDIPSSGASQVLILSGTESDPTGLDPRLFTDCNFFVSGAIGQRGIHPKRGTSVFGGDLHISGNISLDGSASGLGWTDDGTVVRLSTSTDRVGIGTSTPMANLAVRDSANGLSSILISCNASTSASIFFTEGAASEVALGGIIRHGSALTSDPMAPANSIIIVNSSSNGEITIKGNMGDQKQVAMATFSPKSFINPHAGPQILFLSGATGNGTDFNPTDSIDTNFWVSGSVGNKGSQLGLRGTSVFGGDVVASGSMYIEGSDLQIANYLRHIGDTDTYIQFASDQIYVMAGGTVGMHVNHNSSPKKTTFSETGGEETNWEFIGFGAGGFGDTALYIEGDGTSSSGASQVGILTNSPTAALHVNGGVKMDADVTLGNASSDDIMFNGRAASHLVPKTDSTYDLGSVSNRWANIYTGDLHLRNEKGNWTIQEDADKLIVINNITGKKYKMVLAPLEENE
jgi:hypothetical protein